MRVPSGSWDAHFHVLGPQSRFSYAPGRKYTPPDMPVQACLRMHDVLGIERGFVVHPNTHGFDNAVPVDAIVDAGTFARATARRRSRAPAQVPPRIVTSPTLLTGLLKCGCCGAGMTLVTGKGGRYRYYKCNTRIG